MILFMVRSSRDTFSLWISLLATVYLRCYSRIRKRQEDGLPFLCNIVIELLLLLHISALEQTRTHRRHGNLKQVPPLYCSLILMFYFLTILGYSMLWFKMSRFLFLCATFPYYIGNKSSSSVLLVF